MYNFCLLLLMCLCYYGQVAVAIPKIAKSHDNSYLRNSSLTYNNDTESLKECRKLLTYLNETNWNNILQVFFSDFNDTIVILDSAENGTMRNVSGSQTSKTVQQPRTLPLLLILDLIIAKLIINNQEPNNQEQNQPRN